jgi:hypothetical protein
MMSFIGHYFDVRLLKKKFGIDHESHPEQIGSDHDGAVRILL